MFGNRVANTPALIGLVVALWFGSTTVSAQIWPVPPGLSSGQKYRLVFVTAGLSNATSTNIEYYNEFVRGEAKRKDPDNTLNTVWKAIGSTSSADNARYNTLTRATDPSVRIYSLSENLLSVNLVAIGNNDLWDGTITSPINVTQLGVTVTASAPNTYVPVWTGTNSSGGVQSDLGGTSATFGDALSVTGTWINDGALNTSSSCRLYAMSGELTYSVPEPSSLGLGLVLALAGVAWCNRRRKREQERSTNPAQS